MLRSLKILLLEDTETDAELIVRLLRKEQIGIEFILTKNREEFVAALGSREFDVVLSDNSLPQFSGFEALRLLREKFPHTPFILITGTVSEEYAADIIRQGADDYILKDRMIRLPTAIEAAFRQRAIQRENEKSRREVMESAEKYRTLIERISDGFIATNADWTIAHVNRAAEELYKRSADELLGKNLWEAFPQPADNPMQRVLRDAMRHQRNIHLESFSQVINRWVAVSIYPSSSGLSIFFRDITEQKEAAEAVRRSEEKYRVFVERITDAFVAFDKDWRYTYANKQAGELVHRNPDALIGRNVWEEFPDAVGSATYEAFMKAMETQEYVSNTDYYPPLDLWQENHIYPSPDGISVFIRNITQKKKAEEELLQSQRRLNQAQAIAHLGNWEIDLRTNRGSWSEETHRIFGTTPDENALTFDDWMAFVHPDDRAAVKERVQESWLHLTDTSFYHRIIRKDGTVRYLHSESKFELDNEGRPIALYGIMHDITDIREAEEELRVSNERFRSATRATSDVIWELNLETGRYLLHEGRDKSLSGESVFNWRFGIEGDHVFPDDREMVRSDFEAARKDPRRSFWEMEYRVFSPANTLLYVINHAMFIRDASGVATKAVGAMTNVTEKKKLQQELLEQQRREQQKLTAAALEAREKERNNIGAELHDNVNQILVGTNLMLAMIRDDPKKNELIPNCIDAIRQAIAENRKIAHELVSPDLSNLTLLDQVIQLAGNMLETAGIHVEILHDRFREESLGHDHKIALYRILQEQCTNITKYAKASEVIISLSTGPGSVHMVIADNGVGMDMGKKDKGIGLNNMVSRASVFNGNVEIDSSPGNGFRLEVMLQLTDQ